jgi:hypothetical protein
MNRMLYLGTNRLYLNKNMEVVTALVKKVADTRFYGPGFTEPEVLARGVREFVENTGPYDFVFTDAVVLFWDPETGQNPLKGSYNYFSYRQIKYVFQDMIEFFMDTRGAIPSKIFYPNFDPYNMSLALKAKLQSADCYLFTRDKKFWSTKSDMLGLKDEKFASKVNDNWANYISDNNQKVISFHGTVSETDFRFHPLAVRRYDIGVPGVAYHRRKLAANELINSKLNISPFSTGYRRKLRSLLFRMSRSREVLSWFQDSFQWAIEDTRMNYTCGSALSYSIRKYVEIPAKGSLLLCTPFAGFQHVGFESGLNCVALDPKNICEVTNELIKNPEKMQRLASAGQDTVMSLHSFSARLDQLDQMFSSIKSGRFNGSEWIDGELIIKEKLTS